MRPLLAAYSTPIDEVRLCRRFAPVSPFSQPVATHDRSPSCRTAPRAKRPRSPHDVRNRAGRVAAVRAVHSVARARACALAGRCRDDCGIPRQVLAVTNDFVDSSEAHDGTGSWRTEMVEIETKVSLQQAEVQPVRGCVRGCVRSRSRLMQSATAAAAAAASVGLVACVVPCTAVRAQTHRLLESLFEQREQATTPLSARGARCGRTSQ